MVPTIDWLGQGLSLSLSHVNWELTQLCKLIYGKSDGDRMDVKFLHDGCSPMHPCFSLVSSIHKYIHRMLTTGLKYFDVVATIASFSLLFDVSSIVYHRAS